MKSNKSIDGLSPHDAKKDASEVVSRPAKKSKPIKITEPEIIEDSLEITVTPDSKAKPTPHEQTVEDFLKPIQAFDFDEQAGELTQKSDQNSEPISELKTQKSEKPKKAKKSKKKPSKIRRIITSILLLIVLALIGLVIWVVFWGNDIIAKITGGQGTVLDLFTLMDETYEPLKTDTNGRTNILAFGTSGYDMEGDEGNGIHAGAQLTDSIMLISLNQETGDIVMLSLPRDLKASPTCTATGKINEVYRCNNINGDDEASGATALMEEVGSILGIDFQYYAHLNWGSLISIVDTLGGITITLDEDINDSWWTGAVYEAGVPYTINGEEALGLARARHGTVAGDFSRGASQQKILIGIKNKIFEKNLTIPDLISLASTLGDNLRTNFTLSELKTLAHLTYEFDFDNIRQISLLNYDQGIHYMTMGTLDNGISYVFPSAGVGNYDAIQEYVLEQLLWTPPEEPEEDTPEESENSEETD